RLQPPSASSAARQSVAMASALARLIHGVWLRSIEDRPLRPDVVLGIARSISSSAYEVNHPFTARVPDGARLDLPVDQAVGSAPPNERRTLPPIMFSARPRRLCAVGGRASPQGGSGVAPASAALDAQHSDGAPQ